ncbi:amidase domain-containing protein [Staphylococcus simulans]|uniref:amidase domain-containing protein n=1 Tax=Staphylococcus simulans TaxID=1286 RepID=UPI00399AFD5E
MKKQKLLVCMLSTSLLVPSFPLSPAQAETTDKVTAPSQSDSASSDSASETKQDTEDNQKQATKQNKTQKEKTSDSDTSLKSDNKDHADSESNTRTPSKDSSASSSDQTTSNDTESDYDAHTLDFFKSTPKYESSNRFDSFFSRLFPRYQSETPTADTTQDENDSNTDNEQASNNQAETADQHQTNDTTTDDQTNPNIDSSDETTSSEDTSSNQPSSEPEASKDNQDIINQLDEASNKVTNKVQQESEQANSNDTAQSDDTNQTSQSESAEADSTNDTTTDNQSTSDSTQTDATQSSSDNTSNADDRVIESILDRYSEDAKQSKSDYDTKKQNKAQSDKASLGTSNKQAPKDETAGDPSNPQLPSKAQLDKKQKPAQSFEDGLKRSDIRSTATFELLPNLSGDNGQSSDIAVSENKATRDFIKSIAKDAHDVGQDKDIYASVMIAQAILESDSGNSSLARAPHYNLFGIKGAYKGHSANFNTLEDNGGSMYQISAGFRSYPSEKESLEDYADLIKNGIDGNPTIYQPTWKSEAATYRDATRHLAHTYATDSRYADKLNSLIKHYDLTRFDKKKMPDMKNYQPSNEDHEGDFKPFAETTGNMPYPHGQCTWYVYNRMPQFGKTISGDLGDARNWNNRADGKGYHVSSTPKAHTAVVFEAGQQGADDMYGHVAFVEKVNKDGSIVISESNMQGLGVISYRTIDADDAQELSYIEGQDK